MPRAPAGPTFPVAPPIPVAALILASWKHAERYYRRADGTPTAEPAKIKLALRPLRNLYGMAPATEFGPKALKALRQSMVGGGLCRRTVNQRIGIVVRVFRWGVENELVPPAVHQAIRAVEGLKADRSGAKEGRVVGPVADARVDAVRPFVSRQVWAMVELQRLTGMRSTEVATMRTGDIDRAGDVWSYVPARHKGDYLSRGRAVHLGPRAIELLKPWLRADPKAYLFQPRESIVELQADRRKER